MPLFKRKKLMKIFQLPNKRIQFILIMFGITALAAACVPDPYYMNYGSLLSGIETTITVFRVISGIVGVLMLLAGFIIYELLIYIMGFITGGLFGAVIGSLLSSDGYGFLITMLGFLLGGALGAALALFLTYLGVFFSGVGIGIALFSGIWYLIFEDSPPNAVLIIGALLGGVGMILLFRFWIMALTAAFGALLFGFAIDAAPAWWFLFFLIGLGVQTGAAKLLGLGSVVSPGFGIGDLSTKVSIPLILSRIKGEAPPIRDADQYGEHGIVEQDHLIPPPPPQQASLLHPSGAVFGLFDGLVIGRSQTCDIPISDPSVSRQHAVVRLAGFDWFLQDLGSAGGTSVNGQLSTAVKLQAGDQIKIGRTIFTFQI
jgi:hypothetical protein